MCVHNNLENTYLCSRCGQCYPCNHQLVCLASPKLHYMWICQDGFAKYAFADYYRHPSLPHWPWPEEQIKEFLNTND